MKIKNLTQKTHIYYFVIALFIGIICGVVSSLFTNEMLLKNQVWFGLSCGLFIVSIIKLRKYFLVTIFLSGLILGLWRSSCYELSRQDYAKFFGKEVVLKGQVADDVYFGKSGDARFKLKSIDIEGNNYEGEVWVSALEDLGLKRSDVVVVEGTLRNGFGGLFASMSNSDVVSVTKLSSNDIGIVARDSFANATTGVIPEPERSLGLGFLLGQKNSLPEDLARDIQILGLSHIVVASGYNLTILVAFARRLFSKISKYLSAVVGSFLIGGFILITGFSPSMSRAGLVAGLSLTAWYYGRKIHPLVLLLVTAGITLLINPSYIWGDLGWYLSFLAFIGVLIMAPLIHNFFWGFDKKPSWVRELLIVTLSAQLMTLPIILYSFGTFSIYSLLANALILPFIPIAMLGVFVSALTSIFFPIVASAIALPANIVLKYCTFVIDRISNFPGVLSELKLSLSGLVFSYILIVFLLIFLKLKTKHNFINDKMIID